MFSKDAPVSQALAEALAEVEEMRQRLLAADEVREAANTLTGDKLLVAFDRDAYRLIKFAHGDTQARPCEAMPSILRWLGYVVRYCFMPSGKWASVEWAARRVTVNTRPQRRTQPWRTHALECLAHELGHIRLHGPGERRVSPERAELEAELYGLVFCHGFEEARLRARLLEVT